MANTPIYQRCKHRLSRALLGLAFLVVLKAMIQGEIQESNQVGDVFHEAREHIVASMAKYQVPFNEEMEGDSIKGVEINIPFSCFVNERNVTIITLDSLMSFSVPEDTVYANICLKAIGNGCPTLREGVDKFCVNVSIGVGVTHYHYPLCQRMKPHSVVLLQTNHSKVPATRNCSVYISIARHFPQIPAEDSTLLTCAYFQSCTFVFNGRLPCGIHNFANSLRWLDASQQLDDAKGSTLSSLRELYKDRVYPLWLLPCTDACSSNSRCFWHRAKLLRFGLDANRDPEYLEGSGTADFYSGSNALGKVFTPALPNTTWAEMRGYLNNSAILFVGDSTLRGLMYALLSKLNGSLRYWEASHSQLIFESLAGGFFQRTDAKLTKKSSSSVIAFAYFPLFWSRRLHRRTLVDVISQSLGRIVKKNVDLFIGGTQWLSTDEMKRLGYYLLHTKQKKIRRVIIKSHQAGFHIPNYLTHHFSLEEHLWKKRQVNEEVWRLGGELKWARIDAYQLTWSNLFHFSGDFQCSCHFHRTTFNLASGEYIISGEVTEALLQNLVYYLLNDNKA